jgi:ATP-dependent protease ClpP protease subunit
MEEVESYADNLTKNNTIIFWGEIKTESGREFVAELFDTAYRIRPKHSHKVVPGENGEPDQIIPLEQTEDCPRIIVLLNTEGGEVYTALGMHDAIKAVRSMGIAVDIHVQGVAMSGGAIIVQAGTRRFMSERAQLLIHDAIWTFEQEHVDDAMALQEMCRKQLSDLIATRNTRGFNDPAVWIESLRTYKNLLYTAQEAVDAGLADYVEA